MHLFPVIEGSGFILTGAGAALNAAVIMGVWVLMRPRKDRWVRCSAVSGVLAGQGENGH